MGLNKATDLQFNYVMTIDPQLEPWRAYAADWFNMQIIGRAAKRAALDKFLCDYLPRFGSAKSPTVFFLRSTKCPPFMETLSGIKPKGANKINNYIHDFLAWILDDAIAVHDDNGHKVMPAEFYNPVPRLRNSGLIETETVRTPLPFRYIKELREILCCGEHFSDWKWAHKAVDHNLRRLVRGRSFLNQQK